ncbi:MAG: GAF domain-containing protein [Cyanobacteria bacterium HKST-UBA02]|nr:GAF domain-containing protein [Cyanobacteria bacterium HKST-UBA02]
MKSTELVEKITTICRQPGLSPETALGQAIDCLARARPSWHWIGIYILIDDQTLVLGPYRGEPTEHTRIEVGHGVCGTAVAENANQIVADVRELQNYIACSLHTRSEIVVLIRSGERVIGQFDIDSDIEAAFGKDDEKLLEELSPVVAPLVEGILK